MPFEQTEHAEKSIKPSGLDAASSLRPSNQEMSTFPNMSRNIGNAQDREQVLFGNGFSFDQAGNIYGNTTDKNLQVAQQTQPPGIQPKDGGANAPYVQRPPYDSSPLHHYDQNRGPNGTGPQIQNFDWGRRPSQPGANEKLATR